jgi:hypothetical protein
MILATLLISAAQPAPVTEPAHPSARANPPSELAAPVLSEAVCTSTDGRQINMADVVLTISNTKRVGSQYYTIEGDKVLIGNTPTERAIVRIYDVFYLSHATERNIVIFHAELNRIPYIYWVEKLEVQPSRNGLLSIAGDRIAPACEGTIYR